MDIEGARGGLLKEVEQYTNMDILPILLVKCDDILKPRPKAVFMTGFSVWTVTSNSLRVTSPNFCGALMRS